LRVLDRVNLRRRLLFFFSFLTLVILLVSPLSVLSLIFGDRVPENRKSLVVFCRKSLD
jgi:hypothetical protein